MHLGIVGLGQVGSALARHAIERGYQVSCVDVDERVVEAVRAGEYFDVEPADVTATTTAGDVVADLDVGIIAVPTPLTSSYSVDLDSVRGAATDLATALAERSDGTLVVVESTVPPGTTETVVAPCFEERGLTVGEDVYLASAPERIDPGNEDWPLPRIPRVVGAVTDAGQDRAVGFYGDLLDAEVHPVEGPAVAEAAKIVENAFRDVNIAFVNEIAVSLGELSIDTKSVLDAAATKPFGFMRFSPGAGVGGDCIPIDPYLLIERAAGAGFDHEFLKLARDINSNMPEYVVKRTVRALNDAKVLPNGSTALLLGRAFKPGIADDRNSPYHDIVAGLEEYGIETCYYDPYWPEESATDPESIAADSAILVTAHDAVLSLDWSALRESGVEVFVDGRNAVDATEIRDAGLRYVGIGRD